MLLNVLGPDSYSPSLDDGLARCLFCLLPFIPNLSPTVTSAPESFDPLLAFHSSIVARALSDSQPSHRDIKSMSE